MYSYEIEQLLELKNFIIDIKDYCEIVATSPQIDHILFKDNNNSWVCLYNGNYNIIIFYITKDKYSFGILWKKEGKKVWFMI